MSRALALVVGGVAALLVGLGMPAAGTSDLPVDARGLPAAGSLLRPVVRAVMTQPFGCTALALEPVNAGCPGGHFHSGLDLAAPAGTLVRAAAGGSVLSAGWNPAGYGIYVVVDHGRGLTTLYAHLLETSVVAGDRVAAGDQVGQVGSTGNSTGPHLHFEVRSHGRPTDPEPLLAADSPEGGTP